MDEFLTPFTGKQAAELSKVDYGTIRYWMGSQLIVPSVRGPSGRGKGTLWNFKDIYALRVAGELRDAGVSPRAIKNIVNFIQGLDFLDFSNEFSLAISPKGEILNLKEDKKFYSEPKSTTHNVSYLINLSGILKELKDETLNSISQTELFRKDEIQLASNH